MNVFLRQLSSMTDWDKVEAILADVSECGVGGKTKHAPAVLIRAMMLQYCYRLSDAQFYEHLVDRYSWREFVGIPLSEVPTESDIKDFRSRLTKNGIDVRVVNLCKESFARRGFVLKPGAINDARFIEVGIDEMFVNASKPSAPQTQPTSDMGRELIFREAMNQFLGDPAKSLELGSNVINDLIYGWGNERWSALEEYLRACIEHALASEGPILECGSGLSTIVVGAISKQRKIEHWAFEHDDEWAARVRRYLILYAIESVSLCSKPLKDYGEFLWYDPPPGAMPKEFSLIICDGPPGNTRGGRYGLVPVLRDRFAPRCVILLDDVGREQERAIARRWQAEVGGRLDMLGSDKPYARMLLEKPMRSGHTFEHVRVPRGKRRP